MNDSLSSNFQIVAINLSNETYNFWVSTLKDTPHLTNLFLFNVHDSDIPNDFAQNKFFKTSSTLSFSQKSCGVINESYFTVNYEHFIESQKFNTCLNRKISIDISGNIKNCPSMLHSFGNISNTKISSVLDNEEFLKYWKISKNEIDVCKICEFRHVCTDCRAFLQNKNDIYSKPLKCGYDPKRTEWSDWQTNPASIPSFQYYNLNKKEHE
jgi:SPASM domain peptide maturase of grasp-with-spasm system